MVLFGIVKNFSYIFHINYGMKITEKQLQIMLRVLEGSLKIADRTDMNIFGYDSATRKNLFNEIINQQSDEIIEVTEK